MATRTHIQNKKAAGAHERAGAMSVSRHEADWQVRPTEKAKTKD